MTELYYLQDSRTIVGNDLMWWAKNGHGYTSDVSRAEIYSKEDAVRQNQSRETDVPWPKDYIDSKTRPVVDCQVIDIEIALQDRGIVLAEPPKPIKEIFNCMGCGQFLSEVDYYQGCPNCDMDHRP
ncbi:MAG: hypothetical protein DRQ39_07205 [Gammaproteobacteria bacterium]|nr:MAG: hypothetical protein DRQ39_07205 [Gammaproteobacteria bacterium]